MDGPNAPAPGTPAGTPSGPRARSGGAFKHFFLRGLAILLPSVLTIWILVAAYQFVKSRIAAPINDGVRQLVVLTTPWPEVSEHEVDLAALDMLPEERRDFRESGESREWLTRYARREKLFRWWSYYWFPMDLIGLVIAIALIYVAGLVLGSFIGRRLYLRGEGLINRLPLVRRVYPSVKQVTDFFVGPQDQQRLQYSRVVAVEYPRKGLWSLGLVTGETMRDIQQKAGEECLTVFIPSAPTPFTGYVITIRKSDSIELPITVEDAVKFCVSGGVLIPPNQRVSPAADVAAAARLG